MGGKSILFIWLWTSGSFIGYWFFLNKNILGFINALFLIVIALFIFMEALERLYDPPNVQTDKLMVN